MRKLLIAILIFPILSYGEKTPSQCDNVREFARIIMQARQLGTPLAEVYSEDVPEIARTIVLSAWQNRVYKTRTGRSMAISTFSDAWEVECIRRVGL